MKDWEDANAKEIRLIKFNQLDDLADKIKLLGHEEQILILKPRRKGYMAKFKDYLNKDSEQAKVIESLTPFCQTVKTVVELNGRKRTFTIGGNSTNVLSEIDAPEELELESGNPKYESIKAWCEEVKEEFTDSLYNGLKDVS